MLKPNLATPLILSTSGFLGDHEMLSLLGMTKDQIENCPGYTADQSVYEFVLWKLTAHWVHTCDGTVAQFNTVHELYDWFRSEEGGKIFQTTNALTLKLNEYVGVHKDNRELLMKLPECLFLRPQLKRLLSNMTKEDGLSSFHKLMALQTLMLAPEYWSVICNQEGFPFNWDELLNSFDDGR